MSEQTDRVPQNTEAIIPEAARGLSEESPEDRTNVILNVEPHKLHGQYSSQHSVKLHAASESVDEMQAS